jgi:hypothetical protein
MRPIVTLVTLVISALLLAPTEARGCTCAIPGPPCQAYWSTSTVFSGQVTEIKTFTSDDEPFKGYKQKLVRFSVIQAFRGASGTSAETVTGNGGGDCGYPFKVGESYLVYAYHNPKDNRLYASICSRTRRLSEAGEDMEYIGGLSKAASGGRIYGSLNMFRRVNADVSYQSLGPMQGVRIAVEGAGKRFEAITDDKGKYYVSGLEPGAYKVRLTAPKGLWPAEAEHKVNVAEKGCVVVDFTFEPNTSLSGKVFNDDGAPAPKIMVDLVLWDEVNERYQRHSLFTHADEEGRFTFRSIPPGAYFLGIRLNRITEPTFAYSRTFFPGIQDLSQAAAITISEGQILEGYDIQLPQKLKTRKIEGIVVWPDGRPASGAGICFEEVEYAEGSLCFGDANVGDDGRFSSTRPEGLRYLVRAHINVGGGNGQRHAEPVETPAKGDVSDIKLVITEPNGNCAKCRMWSRKKN